MAELNSEAAKSFYDVASKTMPPTNVLIRLILTMVWRRVIRNPNIHSSIIGLVWSLIAFRGTTKSVEGFWEVPSKAQIVLESAQ
ncbi:hypothetical protein U1Q18_002120 [Sarracenia purpurea var. burkii]